MLFLDWKHCEGGGFLVEIDGIWEGMEGTVGETCGLDGMYLLKEESKMEVALSV